MPGPSFLMCRPTFFRIAYEINPWMDVRKQPDRALALRQWRALRRLLEDEIGATVETCRARRGLPDMTFTANAGLACANTFIPSRFRHKQRAGEAPHFTSWFSRRGYRVVPLPPAFHFEGAGDAMFIGRRLFAGFFYRTDIRTHARIAEALDVRVLSLELVDKRFYHLDTCLCPIGRGSAIYYAGAFDRYGLRVLRENVANLLAVDRGEAYRLACNAIVVGKKAVIPKGCPTLARALRKRGFKIFRPNLSEFLKAGGAARCLTLPLGTAR